MIVGINTDKKWISSITKVPIVGGIFIFLMIFIVPVIGSFLCQAIIPSLNNDIGFTKAMLILLPGYNLILWLNKIKLYLLFLPAWALLGGIAIIKIIKMMV